MEEDLVPDKEELVQDPARLFERQVRPNSDVTGAKERQALA